MPASCQGYFRYWFTGGQSFRFSIDPWKSGKGKNNPAAVGVVDERMEIFPIVSGSFCFSPGLRTEVLSGSEKSAGLEILIRTMNPETIAVDEITADTDCMGIVKACCCGVSILATAHAENLSDYLNRPVYAPLIENKVFNHIIVLQRDKSWEVERMNI